MTTAIQDEIYRLIPDENRSIVCLLAIEKIITAHIEAITGVSASGPLNYNFQARTAEELKATQGYDAGMGQARRPTSMSDGTPARPGTSTQPAPARPAASRPKPKTPWS